MSQQDRSEKMKAKKDKDQSGSLLSGQDPHQKEDMDQATKASTAAFNLEPDRGISPDPDQYNQGEEQGNIKQVPSAEGETLRGGASGNFDEAEDNPELTPGEFDVTPEDLENLKAQDRDQNEEI